MRWFPGNHQQFQLNFRSTHSISGFHAKTPCRTGSKGFTLTVAEKARLISIG